MAEAKGQEEIANSFDNPAKALKLLNRKPIQADTDKVVLPVDEEEEVAVAEEEHEVHWEGGEDEGDGAADENEEPVNSFENPAAALQRKFSLHQKKTSPLVVPQEDPEIE